MVACEHALKITWWPRFSTYPKHNIVAKAHITRDSEVVKFENIRNVLKAAEKVFDLFKVRVAELDEGHIRKRTLWAHLK